MVEYIKREELVARLKRNLDACNTGTIETLCFRDAIMIAQSLPAADVAPVVRCKDCKHLTICNNKHLYAICEKTGYGFKPFDTDTRIHFCSYGERRDE